MQSLDKKTILIFLLVFFTGCISKQEKESVDKLNEQYSDYHFKGSGGVHLNVYLKKSTIDTSEIISIYKDIFLVCDTSNKIISSKMIGWVYLNVFDNKGHFCFQLLYDTYGNQEFKFKKKAYY